MADAPPGPKGDPFFGASRRYARDPFAFIEAVEDAYGDVARFDMGPVETYMVTSPAAIERILVSEADAFRKPDVRDDALGDLLGDGLLLGGGETWRRQRDLANPAFSMSRLEGLTDRIADHAARMVEGWTAGDAVDAESEMARVTLHVILDLMLGVELPPERVATIEDQLEPLGRRFEPDPLRFAAPEWLPTPGDQEFASAVGALDDVLDDVVAARRGTEGDPFGEGPMDLLSILLRARGRGEQSADQLRDEMMTMLLAGHDTTALTLTYTFFLLSDHPEAQRRVVEEVDDVVDGDRPGAAAVRELTFAERVLDEAMRLYPPVFRLFRTPTEPVEVAGYRIPAGAVVMLPQWGVHRSGRYWDDPETFDPDRFRPERSTDRHRFAFFPFGGGPRHCVGKNLAMLEAKVILATVLSAYELEFEGERPIDPMPSLTMHPRQEMTMRVRER